MQSENQGSGANAAADETAGDAASDTVAGAAGATPDSAASGSVQTDPLDDILSDLADREADGAGSDAGVSIGAPGEPLIDGPTDVLWAGAATIIACMALIFFVMMRGRARRSRQAAADTQYFEPAGDDADISFDSEAAPLKEARNKEAKGGKRDEREASVSVVRDDTGEDEQTAEKPAFSRLFAKADEAPNAEADPSLGESLSKEAQRRARLEAEQAAAAEQERRRREVDARRAEAAERRAAEEAVARERAAFDATREAAQRQQKEQERRLAAREAELAAEIDAQARSLEHASARAEETISARIDNAVEHLTALIDQRMPTADAIATSLSTLGLAQTAHGGGADRDEIFQLLHGVEDALAAQSEGLKAETRNMVSELAGRLQKQMGDIEHTLATPQSTALFGQAEQEARASVQKIDGFSQRLATHEVRIEKLFEAFGARLAALEAGAAAAPDVAALQNEIRALRANMGGAAGPGGPAMNAPRVHLADLMREALPASSYDMNVMLSNNRRADCLVRLPAPLQPIVIDAQFPLEAFHTLGHDEAAAKEFKRLALRHVVTVAEHFIHPRETGDAALMLIASEAHYAEFMARFPDVMQDASRAHVWIVSPTSLAATLNTLRALTLHPEPRTPEPRTPAPGGPAPGPSTAAAPSQKTTPPSSPSTTSSTGGSQFGASATTVATNVPAEGSNGVAVRPPLQDTRALTYETDQRYQTGERSGEDAPDDAETPVGSSQLFSAPTNDDAAPEKAQQGDLMDHQEDETSDAPASSRRPSDFLR